MSDVNKETALRLLSPVHEGNRFWSSDGKVFHDLESFYKGLQNMNAENFNHHVNKEKNDFSIWVYDIIGDQVLAESLRKSKDKKTSIKRAQARINYLKSIVD